MTKLGNAGIPHKCWMPVLFNGQAQFLSMHWVCDTQSNLQFNITQFQKHL
jgi:hypothetical protein